MMTVLRVWLIHVECSVDKLNGLKDWLLTEKKLSVDLREIWVGGGGGGQKKQQKKALKMTSQLVIFRAFFVCFLYLQKKQ